MDAGRFYRRKKELTENQLNDLRDSFDAFDKNGSNSIRPDDLWIVLRALGREPRKAEMKAFLEAVAADGGAIDFDRYLQLILGKMAERPTDSDIEKAFRHFDRGTKGSVSAQDLRRMADKIGETITDEEIAEMISEADSSGTGQVDPVDFQKIVTSYAQHYDR